MHSHFTAVFDACVLYPALLRNVLMQLATTGLFRARWTDAIHEEWIRNLRADKPDISHEDIVIRDFPESVLSPFGIRAEEPDEFLLHLVDLAPAAICLAIKELRARLRNPPYTAHALLDRLHEHGLVGVAAKLRDFEPML